VRALLCVATPLREPVQVPCPFAVLIGDRDQNLAVGVEAYASCLPDPSRLRIVPGTDHFWQGFEAVLVDAAHEFFAEVLAAPAKAAP
jgi:alpha/beta superfamily hydrolase